MFPFLYSPFNPAAPSDLANRRLLQHSGAWLVVPSYIIYQLGSEIIEAITIASYATGSIKAD